MMPIPPLYRKFRRKMKGNLSSLIQIKPLFSSWCVAHVTLCCTCFLSAVILRLHKVFLVPFPLVICIRSISPAF